MRRTAREATPRTPMISGPRRARIRGAAAVSDEATSRSPQERARTSDEGDGPVSAPKSVVAPADRVGLVARRGTAEAVHADVEATAVVAATQAEEAVAAA